jgi:hypothetical protein
MLVKNNSGQRLFIRLLVVRFAKMLTNEIDGFLRQARRTAATILGSLARLCNNAWRKKTRFHVSVLVKCTLAVVFCKDFAVKDVRIAKISFIRHGIRTLI